MAARDEIITVTCQTCGLEWLRERRTGALPRYCDPCRKEARRQSYQTYYDGLPAETKAEWQRRDRLKRDYGITPEEYDDLFARQGQACAICGSPESRGKNWHVDHCHVSGAVRGVLCHFCNVGLGNFRDDIAVLEAAINYLKGGS